MNEIRSEIATRNQFSRLSDLPECCKGCNNIEDGEYREGYPPAMYCEKGIFLPKKKQTCKKMRK